MALTHIILLHMYLHAYIYVCTCTYIACNKSIRGGVALTHIILLHMYLHAYIYVCTCTYIACNKSIRGGVALDLTNINPAGLKVVPVGIGHVTEGLDDLNVFSLHLCDPSGCEQHGEPS